MSQLKSSTRTSLLVEISPNYSLDFIDPSNKPHDVRIFSDDDIMFSDISNREERNSRKHHKNDTLTSGIYSSDKHWTT